MTDHWLDEPSPYLDRDAPRCRTHPHEPATHCRPCRSEAIADHDAEPENLPTPRHSEPRMNLAPPIPGTCANRPTVGGLVAPFVNITLADGGVDFRSPHQGRYERCWREGLCQTCGGSLASLVVFFGGPRQLRTRSFDEPPLCLPCAVYASQACPMVAGRMTHYADRERLAQGKRGHVCPDASCDCGGFTDSDPNAYDASGEPAHDWYAVYVRTGDWQLTANVVTVPCSDRGCLHDRTLINGCQLTAEPRKVVLVSTQAEGRVWRRLDPAEHHARLAGDSGEVPDVVHLIRDGSATTACCYRTPFELPRAGGHRLTQDSDAVTCGIGRTGDSGEEG